MEDGPWLVLASPCVAYRRGWMPKQYVETAMKDDMLSSGRSLRLYGAAVCLATVSAVPPQTHLQGEVDLARLVDLCAQRLDRIAGSFEERFAAANV